MPECGFHETATGAANWAPLCHLLLLHGPLQVYGLDTCYPRLNRACEAVSKCSSRGEGLLLSPGKGEHGHRHVPLTRGCQVKHPSLLGAWHPSWGPSGSISPTAWPLLSWRLTESQVHLKITAESMVPMEW